MDEKIEKQTVLVVDDEPVNIRIFTELLRSDCTIKAATHGEKALEIALADNPPDLILLDIVMPGMDGFEVCRKLKAETRTRNIPIIFITAKGSEEDQIRGFELGAVDYVTKPFIPIVVKARVKTHLELKKNRDFLEWMLKERNLELQTMEKEYMYLFLRK
ncbi:MAG: response regulator [Syntrophaceae bacterium]|jgi:putative two-component system response regulator|nr:response regulator [Syntrophaceae bacterium]